MTRGAEGGKDASGLTAAALPPSGSYRAREQRAYRREVARTRKVPLWVWPIVAAVHLPVTARTWRDLRERPASEVRGNPTVWKALAATNISWSLAYWLLGRR